MLILTASARSPMATRNFPPIRARRLSFQVCQFRKRVFGVQRKGEVYQSLKFPSQYVLAAPELPANPRHQKQTTRCWAWFYRQDQGIWSLYYGLAQNISGALAPSSFFEYLFTATFPFSCLKEKRKSGMWASMWAMWKFGR